MRRGIPEVLQDDYLVFGAFSEAEKEFFQANSMLPEEQVALVFAERWRRFFWN